MFQEVKKVVCPDIPPFSSAEKVCALADNGYFEEEYYLYGTSNLYSRNPETNPGRCALRKPLYPPGPERSGQGQRERGCRALEPQLRNGN